MSYSDDYKDHQHAAFLAKWTPNGTDGLAPTEENLRYNIARARAAEAELSEIKRAAHALRKALS